VNGYSAMKRLTFPSVLLVIAFFAGIGPLLSTNSGGGPVPKARQHDLIGHDGWELVTYTHTRAAQIQ
jgi:hypothetical protein